MKRVLLIGLVLLMIFSGIPLVMAMPAMERCPECQLAAGAVAMCLAVLALFVLLVPTVAARLARRDRVLPLFLLRSGLDHPPRTA
jgi:hypothetical protein